MNGKVILVSIGIAISLGAVYFYQMNLSLKQEEQAYHMTQSDIQRFKSEDFDRSGQPR